MTSKEPDKLLHSLLAAIPADVSIDRYLQHEHTIELFVSWKEPVRGERICPNCASTRCIKKDSGAFQTVRHVKSGSSGTIITFHKPRFFCKECRHTFFMKPSWVYSKMSITNYLLLAIATFLVSTSNNIEQIARDTSTTPAIVRNVIRHIELPKPSYLPETLGIDEFHGQTGTYNKDRGKFDTEKYHCVITSPDEGCVIDILFKATFRELHDYFMDYPPHIRQSVRFFCSDMRSGFSKVAKACFPKAKICIDPFHVIKLLTDAVSSVRIETWRSLNDKSVKAFSKAALLKEKEDISAYNRTLEEAKKFADDAALIKSCQRILITSPLNDSAYWNKNPEKREERLAEIFAIAPDLKVAYDAIEDFYNVTALPDFNARHSCLSEWLNTYLLCEVPAIRQAANSIEIHRKGIENSWRYNKSNGPTEGLNRRIKDCRRMAFGAHDFENFRKRALLACGSTKITRDNWTIFNEKKDSLPSPLDPANKGEK